ncbi:MAG: ABC transporter permease [Planctomycetota bacterium]|nr:MAG: ABC transporter permease [Planctomycetota bacterium]
MLTATGSAIIRAVDTAGRAMVLLGRSGWQLSMLRLSGRQLLRQLDMAAVGSVVVLALIAALTGMIMVMQTGPALEPYGAIDAIGAIVGASFMREMAPLWAAVIVLARVGSAMAAELGTMVVNEEVEALEVMDIDPIRYLVVPRLLALMIGVPILALVANLVGLLGGSFVAQTQFGVSYADFFQAAAAMLTWWDLLGSQLKAFTFAIIIAVIACDQGLNCRGGAEGVGKATTTAVRLSVVFVLVADLILTAFLNIGWRMIG